MLQVDTSNDKEVIEWSIKNFSSCSALEGEKLECPVRTEGNLFGTAWVLLLYPRGKPGSDPNYLGCSLKREVDEVGPERVPIEFEFSLVTCEGTKKFAKSARIEFQRGSCFGFPEFAKLEEIFSRKELLFDDTLKFRCEFRLVVPLKKQMSVKKIVSSFPTKIITKSMHLENFQKIGKQNPMVLTISDASEKQLLLIVSMNRGGTTGDEKIAVEIKDDEFPESYLHMVMIKKKWDQPLHVACCIQVLKKFEIATETKIHHLFAEIKEKEEWVLPHLIDTNSLGDDCIDNGSLNLYFTFTICDKPPVVVSIIDATPRSLRDGPKTNTLIEDMVDLYQTREFTDITLRVGDVSIQAHKSILATRSPKFREILKKLKKKGAKCENSIEMGDIDAVTMERMLKFIYTGELEDLDDEGSLLIYTAAQKYRISSLRCKCIWIFRKNLTLKTVYKVLVVAEEFKDSELKLLAQEHIERHYGYVVLTPEWQAFTEEHKEIYSEVVKYLRMKRQRELGA